MDGFAANPKNPVALIIGGVALRFVQVSKLAATAAFALLLSAPLPAESPPLEELSFHDVIVVKFRHPPETWKNHRNGSHRVVLADL